MLLNLLELADRTGEASYRRRAELGLRAFAGDLERSPAAAPVLALAVLAAGDAAPPGGGAPGAAPGAGVVTATARSGSSVAADGWRSFRVLLEIADGWHVNANPASLEFLIPTRVAGAVRSVAYPEP